METSHSEDMVAVWFKLKTGNEIHRSVVGKSLRAGFHELDSMDRRRKDAGGGGQKMASS